MFMRPAIIGQEQTIECTKAYGGRHALDRCSNCGGNCDLARLLSRVEEDRYRQKIPVEVGVGNVVAIAGESAFREGCGFAVFELSSKMKERIRSLEWARVADSARE